MAWPTAEDIERVLRPASPVDTDSVDLGIEFAKAVVRNYTGQHLDLVEDDEVQVSGPVGRHLFLPEAPIVEVTAVSVGDTDLVVGDWAIDPAAGVITRTGGYWVWTTSWYETVTVTYSHGYVEIPDDIRMVTATAVARWYENPTGDARESIADFSVSFAQSAFNQGAGMYLLDAEKAILDRYRLVTVR